MKLPLSALACVLALVLAMPAADAAPPEVRMYRLDCGKMRLGDKALFSDAGLYKGEQQDIVMSCYLIRHGKDWLLWDTGLPKKYLKGPLTEQSFTSTLDRTIVDQLRDLKLSAKDIKYVLVSHTHFDHTGQLSDFPNATLIIQRAEVAAIADGKKATEHHIHLDLLKPHIANGRLTNVRVIDGDVDLFGDGTLKTIHIPGHTPGSMALLINFRNAGPYILSGDQWHFTENRQRNQVPAYNYSHDDTLASAKKLEAAVTQNHATLVLQHEPTDNAKLPKPPAYLD